MKNETGYKINKKQGILLVILLMNAVVTLSQRELIHSNRRMLVLLGIIGCGMIYVAFPWEKLDQWMKEKWKWAPDVNRLLSRILLLASPLVSFYLVQIFGGFTDKKFLKLLFSLKGGCNLLLYASLGYFLYLLCNRAKYTAALLTGISALFGLANYFVVLFRESPILAADLESLGTAMDVAGGYEYQLDYTALKALVMTIVFCCVILRQKSYRWLRWKKRVVVLAGGVCLYLALSAHIFSGTFFRKNNISLSVWNPKYNYMTNGSMLSLVISYSYYHVEKPEGYSPQKAQELASAYTSDAADGEEQQQPNVIAIMNEAFADMSVLGTLDISEDVMPFVRNMEEDTVKGNLYVSIRTSQTANSEFEFLTGCTMGFLPYRSIPYNSYVKEEMPGLTSTLESQGYGRNLAVHPGEVDAWNRDVVYSLLGFEEFQSVEDLEIQAQESDYIHGYLSDAFGYEHLISEYEAYRETEENPFYSFFVTIQNHGGYKKNLVDVTIPLANADQWGEDMEQYLNLIKISDDAIAELIAYFEQVDEPTLIVMFGDHQPGISPKAEAKTYTSMLDMYAVPYFIWANYDIEEEEKDMSANYLSAYLLKVMDANMTGFQKYLLDLQDEVPIITANGYVGVDGSLYGWDQESAYTSLLEEYSILQYNDLFDYKNRVNEFFYLQE